MNTIQGLILFIISALTINFLVKYIDSKLNFILFIRDTFNVDNKQKNGVLNTFIILFISIVSCFLGRIFGVRQLGGLLLCSINVGIGMNFIFM